MAKLEGVDGKVSFKVIDASKPLPYAEGSFDAVFCNDSMCHIPGRQSVLEDWRRVLKPGGRIVFTDAMVVSGIVSSEEFATRCGFQPHFRRCFARISSHFGSICSELQCILLVCVFGPSSRFLG